MLSCLLLTFTLCRICQDVEVFNVNCYKYHAFEILQIFSLQLKWIQNFSLRLSPTPIFGSTSVSDEDLSLLCSDYHEFVYHINSVLFFPICQSRKKLIY